MFRFGSVTWGLNFPPRLVGLENKDQVLGSGIGLRGLESQFYYFLSVETSLDTVSSQTSVTTAIN